MIKVFKFKNLDCAHCALKMQQKLEKIDGVNKVDVNILTEKLTIDATEEFFDKKINDFVKICKKFDGCQIIL